MSRESEVAAEHAIGPSGMGMDTGRRLSPTHEEIAQLAFNLYEARGRQEGQQLEDWLSAEQELVQHCA